MDKQKNLIEAIRQKNIELVRKLLQSFSDREIEIHDECNPEDTALTRASCDGSIEIVEILIIAGFDVDYESYHGTPLYVASEYGNVEIVGLLTNAMCTLNKGFDVYTPLYVATQHGHTRVVKQLIHAANVRDEALSSSDVVNALEEACSGGHGDIVCVLLCAFCTTHIFLQADEMMKSPMYAAVRNGHEEIVQQLIEAEFDTDKAPTGGISYLFTAIDFGYESIVLKLLKSGCNPNIRISKWSIQNDYTPLSLAINMRIRYWSIRGGDEDMPLSLAIKYPEIIRKLVQFDCNVNLYTLKSPLYNAARNGEHEIVCVLLQAGADKENKNRQRCFSHVGETPLHGAVQSGVQVVVQTLIDAGCDINSRIDAGSDINANGNTPLIEAIRWNRVDILNLLIASGANKEKSNNNGVTPIIQAVILHNVKILEILLARGCMYTHANKATGIGETALFIAVKKGNVEIVNILLAHGVDKNQATHDGETPVFIAAKQGNVKILEILLARGCNANKATVIGETALFIAVKKGNVEIVNILLAHGVDKNQATHDGETPVFIAAKQGNVEIVNILLAHGCDIEIPRTDGFTPLDVAIQENKQDVVRILYIFKKVHFQNLYLAFAMSAHTRLGFASSSNQLNDDLRKQIFDQAEIFHTGQEQLRVNDTV